MILRYFSSNTLASTGTAGLQSRVFCSSGLFGFVKKAHWWFMRKSRASARLSNTSSLWMKGNDKVLYLVVRQSSVNAHDGKEDSVRFGHDDERLDPLSVTEVIDDIPAHIGRV